jgi:hypothetical protein
MPAWASFMICTLREVVLEQLRRGDIFNVFLKFVKEFNLPLSKLVAITTGRNNWFLALCAKDE